MFLKNNRTSWFKILYEMKKNIFSRPFMLPNLVPPKIPDGERVDFDVSKITIATPTVPWNYFGYDWSRSTLEFKIKSVKIYKMIKNIYFF